MSQFRLQHDTTGAIFIAAMPFAQDDREDDTDVASGFVLDWAPALLKSDQ
jgi:hypothetical protein